MISLRKRIQIILMFLVCISLLLLLYESYRASRQALVAQMKQGSLQIARLQTAEMDLVFDPPRVLIGGIVRALENAPQLKADSIRDLIHRTLIQSPEIYGMAVALDPESTPLGRFAPCFCRRGGMERECSLAGPSMDYVARDWYRLPLESQKAIWTRPYFDEGDADAFLVTFSSPNTRPKAGGISYLSMPG